MLPTFVIGLREGLEAALIVGIVAAFLKQRDRRDLLRLVWLGIAAAGVVCVAVGVGLQILSADLPQRQQEGLETVIGTIAVLMVTYMVIWMRRNSRGLKKQLEGAAGSAMESGSGMALVAMAFLAVFREGFETAVFLVAAFNNAASPAAAGSGAVLGVLVAVVLGYGIYRGGVRINLSKFFRATGIVLVVVAAGLVVSVLHTAHEAGWLNVGQGRTIDLTWLVSPGSVQSSLLTGILGLQPRPVMIELIGWLAYIVPVGLYVAWPPGRAVAHRRLAVIGASVAAAALVAGVALSVAAPASPSDAGTSSFALATNNGASISTAPTRAQVSVHSRSADSVNAIVSLDGSAVTQGFERSSTETVDGRAAVVYRGTAVTIPAPSGLPTTMTAAQILERNGGRLPVGVSAASLPAAVPVSYVSTRAPLVVLDSKTGRVLDVRLDYSTATTAVLRIGPTTLGAAQVSTVGATAADVQGAVSQASRAGRDADQRALLRGWASVCWVLVGFGLVVAAMMWALIRRSGTKDNRVAPAPSASRFDTSAHAEVPTSAVRS